MPLPTTRIGSLTLTRLVMGGNPISGFSHAGAKRDGDMTDYFTAANVKALFRRLSTGGDVPGFTHVYSGEPAFEGRVPRVYRVDAR